MKQFCIFFIICSLGTPTILGFGRPIPQEVRKRFESRSLEETVKELQECGRELNLNTITSVSGAVESVDTSLCLIACSMRKATVERLIGLDNKTTFYNVLLEIIDDAYKTGFGNKSNEFTQEDVVNQIEKCYASERTECEFVKCLYNAKSPGMEQLVYYAMQNNLLA